jgi:3-oxoacyl-[acyl-carrier-protein] synthase II
MGRVGVLSVLAVRDAIADSGLPTDLIASPQCGVSFGSTAGSSQSQEEFLRPVMIDRSLRGLQASTYLHFMSHTCAANIALVFGCKGPVIASCTACTSGSQGIGLGYEQIRFGRSSVVLAGGADELHVLHAGIFDILLATSSRYNDSPDRSPRPFDADRDGLVVGEGSGCLLLEELEHARHRGAHIYGEIIGYGSSCNGTHPTNSDPIGIQLAMEAGLRDAGLAPHEIQHINAHATATDIGDAAEAIALHEVFGSAVPISAIKGYMGHTLGACGAIEAAATLVMMAEGFMAPSRNLKHPDPKLPPLDHVMGDPREAKLTTTMSNNFAFGGINTSLVFRAV